MSDLRNHLFEALEALKDEDKPMELARAKVISDVAQTIINSAKVEVEFLDALGATGSAEFFDGLDLEVLPEQHKRRRIEAGRRA
ncbi:MAG TPA: hypothetical protein VGN16_20990 [Acidobacteriaceae bacterium]